MSSVSHQVLGERLIDLQRTVERLTSHLQYLQQQLAMVQGATERRREPWLWRRFNASWGRESARRFRENRRIGNAARTV